jgi:hypothetical protein
MSLQSHAGNARAKPQVHGNITSPIIGERCEVRSNRSNKTSFYDRRFQHDRNLMLTEV